MTDITLKEYINNGGLWGRIRATGLCPIPETSTITDVIIDGALKAGYGSRIVGRAYAELGPETTAQLIAARFSETWTDLVALNKAAIPVAGPVVIRHDIGKRNDENTRKSETLNKTSAFDSAEMVTDGGTDSTGDDVTATNHENTITTETQDASLAIENLRFKASASIINNVIRDIVDCITLKIY